MSGDGMVNLAPHGWPIALTRLSEHRALEARARDCLPWINGNAEAARNRRRTVRHIFIRWYETLLLDLPLPQPALVLVDTAPAPSETVVQLFPAQP